MKKSLILGSFLGIALTAAIAYYLYTAKIINLSAFDSSHLGLPVDPPSLPLVSTAAEFDTQFAGSTDLLKHFKTLSPYLKPENWDQALKTYVDGKPILETSATSRCADFRATKALYFPPEHIQSVKTGARNIAFIMSRRPHCFVIGSTVALAADERGLAKTPYLFAGQAEVLRAIEAPAWQIPNSFFSALKMSRDEVSYLYSLTNRQPANSSLIVVLFKYKPEMPNFTPGQIPPFFVEGNFLSPEEFLKRHMFTAESSKVLLVDTRDPISFRSGTAPGAINVPFNNSNPAQLQFQVDMPLELLSGASVDFSQLKSEDLNAVFLFGRDATDPRPLWVARQLSKQSARPIFIIEGGLEALLPVMRSLRHSQK